MNDRYGVDPTTPASRRDLADLLRLFDPSEGRFVVGFPDDWSDRLRSHIGAWSDLDRQRGEEAAMRLKRVLLPSKLRYDERRGWAENANDLPTQERVRSLIGPSGSPANVDVLQDLMEATCPLPMAREALIVRRVEDYVDAVEPLFRTTRKVVMIDPWFQLHDEFRQPDLRQQVLARFLCEAERCGVCAFHLVVDPHKAYAKWDRKGNSYDEELRALKSGITRIEFKFAPRPDCGHARYMLGNYSGIQFDHGFAVEGPKRQPKPGKLNHVHWLTEDVIGRLHRQYGWT